MPNWLAKVTIWAWAGVTSKETVLPAGIDFVSGALGSSGLGARDVVDGKYADVLQDGLAEGFANAQAGIRANEDLHVATRSGEHQSAVDCLGSDRNGNHAEPLGNQAVGGHLAAGEEFGLDDRLAGEDLLPRAAAIEVFLADSPPRQELDPWAIVRA